MPDIYGRDSNPFTFSRDRAFATPFQFYTSGSENLRISSVNALAGVRVVVYARMLTEAPEPIWQKFDHTPNSDRTVKTTDHALGRGFVLNIVAFAEGAAPKIGQTFVQVEIVGGLGGATVPLGTLLQGYITSVQKLAWPGSPIQSSIEGGGVIRLITGTDPAAGQPISETIPTGARWELLAIDAELATSGAAGTRIPFLSIGVPGNSPFRSSQATTIAAGASNTFRWAKGAFLETSLAPASALAGLPTDLPFLAGQAIVISADGLDAGDNWTAPQFVVREWLEAQ